jgi:hypothetical protein
MAQTEMATLMSLSLSAKNWAGCKRAERSSLCPVFGLVSALRLLSSRAVPSARVPGFYHAHYQPFPKGTFLLCKKGDISTLP